MYDLSKKTVTTHFEIDRSVISVLQGMPARTSDEKGVCPSVKRVHFDKTEERSVQIVYHTKDHLA